MGRLNAFSHIVQEYFRSECTYRMWAPNAALLGATFPQIVHCTSV